MENDKEIMRLYLFELLERIARFSIHLDEIRDQFFLKAKTRVDDKLIFLQSYKGCLLKCIEIANSIDKNIESKDYGITLDQIRKLVVSVNHLHKKYLMHLPRPSEPIELKRFARIIDKHVLNLKEVVENTNEGSPTDSVISIYLSEEVGESTFIADPVHEFKQEQLNRIVSDHNGKYAGDIQKFPIADTSGINFHISIPRIDANNPCRWPTLIHEVAHKVIKNNYFGGRSIYDDFIDSLDTVQEKFVRDISKQIDMLSWLTECWCDLLACIVTGPVFWFSQYSAFIFQEKVDSNKIDRRYPKALFRLKLIQRVLQHRFTNIITKKLLRTLEDAESVLKAFDKLDEKGFLNNDDIRQLFIYFRVYFVAKFLGKDGYEFGINLKSSPLNLRSLIKYTEEIEEKTIESLVENLKDGYPIPGKRISESTLQEKPTLVQEILLAAWLYRNNELRFEILDKLKKLEEGPKSKELEECLDLIVDTFKRFDKSILRSIQVSEWFDILEEKNEKQEDQNEKSKVDDVEEAPKTILNDKQIKYLLGKNELRVIPIISLRKQLGSTSIDIRLGTSFQIYLLTKYGEHNFTDSLFEKKIENSKMIDLDFLESITISPGQFILGHSMEYLKLPANLAGQVEGRSSFARLGLQVHMTAGFIDPGFEGVLTFEIGNSGPNPITLFPGLRIAQVRLFSVNIPDRPYDRNIEAKYKGLLTHHDSKRFQDYEMKQIQKEIGKRR
ncbi:MAG: dCTP deaminase [Desulfobacterales bacterium]|nr:dCTP deaminase [Desulfobacterales bacterium]